MARLWVCGEKKKIMRYVLLLLLLSGCIEQTERVEHIGNYETYYIKKNEYWVCNHNDRTFCTHQEVPYYDTW